MIKYAHFLVAFLVLANAAPSDKITVGPHPWPGWVKLHQGSVPVGQSLLNRGDNGTQAHIASEAHGEHKKEEEAAGQSHGDGHGHSQDKTRKTLEAAEGAYKKAKAAVA